MPDVEILRTQPAAEAKRISKKLIDLRRHLDNQVPARTVDNTFLLATWNIREFDSTKFGLRDDESILYIAEIISRFDLVAVQEVREDLTAFNRLRELLGSWWQAIFTDVTEGSRGNRERMAFLYDSRKVKFGGLSGEIVIPEKNDMTPSEQLARTPFLVGFQSGWFKFMISTVHIYYGTDSAVDPRRLEEIKIIAKTLKERATDTYAFAPNMILLGDFNIFSPNDVTFKAITNAGFWIPESIQKLPSNVPQNKHYDQIAFVSQELEGQLASARAGVFNFFETLFKEEEEAVYIPKMGPDYEKKSSGGSRTVKEMRQYYLDWRTYQMSDHLPMWVELRTDFSDEYLKEMAEGPSPAEKPASTDKPKTSPGKSTTTKSGLKPKPKAKK